MPLHLSKVLQDHTKKDYWPEALKEEMPTSIDKHKELTFWHTLFSDTTFVIRENS